MILGIAGSGRTDSNSEHLLRCALDQARRRGARTRTVRLAELHYRGCTGCGACRSGAERCVLEDDLTPVLEATAAARALVLAAPIYYGYPSGPFKSYLDRWYAFRAADRGLRVPAGRPAVLILTQGHPDPDGYPWTVQSLDKVLTSYGFDPHILVAAGVSEPGAAAGRVDLEERARALGETLADRDS
jgi:multimeric flavodoxin WrbA